MESCSNNSHQQAQVAAEVRRIHVIYFLSRKGRIEHPHLIRVHHLSRNGVHLRDVKRWLAELRGKDMPESFAWSYKRRYKSGYVWQDLLDEDLITPISDNEYVLKGSEISSSSSSSSASSSPIKEDSNVGKKYSIQKEREDSNHSPSFQEQQHHHHHQQEEEEEEEEENKRQEPGKMSSPEIEEESQTFSSDKSSALTEDYQEQGKQYSSGDLSTKQAIEEISDDKVEKHSLLKTLSKKKNHNKANNDIVASSEEKTGTPSSATSASSKSQPSFSKSRSYSNGASHLFRNLISCGAIDTNDSAMVTINRSNKPSMNMESPPSGKLEGDPAGFPKVLLQKVDKLGGSQRVIGTKWMQPRQTSGRKSYDGGGASPKNYSSEFSNQNANPAYKPIYGPQCSQCGKPFKPEKLHAHMKSCKGMKAWAKYSGRGISAENAVESSAESQENLIPRYFLTQR